MPTYEYICDNEDCSHEWEQVQAITDEPEKTCPECKKETAKRQISCTAFSLQGPRWARDGYTG
jgi:putative FmdB family regulatory protein